MSFLVTWIAAFLILIGSVRSQESFTSEAEAEGSPRLGFSLIDPVRRMFCQSGCTAPSSMPYIVNLLCAIKCPELYLPTASLVSDTASASSALPTSTSAQTTGTTGTVSSNSASTSQSTSTTVPSTTP